MVRSVKPSVSHKRLEGFFVFVLLLRSSNGLFSFVGAQ